MRTVYTRPERDHRHRRPAQQTSHRVLSARASLALTPRPRRSIAPGPSAPASKRAVPSLQPSHLLHLLHLLRGRPQSLIPIPNLILIPSLNPSPSPSPSLILLAAPPRHRHRPQSPPRRRRAPDLARGPQSRTSRRARARRGLPQLRILILISTLMGMGMMALPLPRARVHRRRRGCRARPPTSVAGAAVMATACLSGR